MCKECDRSRHDKREKRCRECDVDTLKGILDGRQEVPIVETEGYGKIGVAFDCKDHFTVSGYFKKLSSRLLSIGGTPAHIHRNLAGRNGEVKYSLTVKESKDGKSGKLSPCDNRFKLAEGDTKQDFLEGKLYVNIHTEDHPSGELRAQLLPESKEQYIVLLDGSNEVPPVDTNANGKLVGYLEDCVLTLTGSVNNIESGFLYILGTPGHIHEGEEGQNGPVVRSLALQPNEDPCNCVDCDDRDDCDGCGTEANIQARDNSFILSGKQKKTLNDKGYYVNIHSNTYGSGELRAQIIKLGRKPYHKKSDCGCE